MSKNELLAYLGDSRNGLTKRICSATIDYSITYRPNRLVFYKDRGQSDVEEYEGRMYFVLNLSRDGNDLLAAGPVNSDSFLKELSFGMRENVSIVECKTGKLIRLSDSAYPRTYGALPYTSLLLCFAEPSLAELGDFEVQVKDIENPGLHLKFKFQKEDINKANNISIN